MSLHVSVYSPMPVCFCMVLCDFFWFYVRLYVVLCASVCGFVCVCMWFCVVAVVFCGSVWFCVVNCGLL